MHQVLENANLTKAARICQQKQIKQEGFSIGYQPPTFQLSDIPAGPCVSTKDKLAHSKSVIDK